MNLIDILKIRLGIAGTDDDILLQSLLDYAKVFILGYTRRTGEEWLSTFDSVQVKIAAIEYGQMGAEGVSSRTEGNITTSFLGSEDYPASVLKLLNPYRRAKVL